MKFVLKPVNNIESEREKVEGRNLSIRKHILKYDDVMNLQRDLIYKDRRKVLFGETVTDNIKKMVTSVASDVVLRFTTEKYVEDWDFESLRARVEYIFNIPDFTVEKERYNGLIQEELVDEC